MSFGIDANTRSTNTVPFKVTKEHWYNLAALESVSCDSTEIKSGKQQGQTIKTLNFKFVAINPVTGAIDVAQHNEKFFPVDPTGAKAKEQQQYLNQKIKHLYEAYAPFPSTGLGFGATDWDSFFQKLADDFNVPTGTGDTATTAPIYKTTDGKLIPVYLYLTYRTGTGSSNGLLQIPLPNFIEKALKTTDGKAWAMPKLITVGRNDVVVRPEKGATGSPTNQPVADREDLPPGFGG